MSANLVPPSLHKLSADVGRFFLREEAPYGVALARMLLAVPLMFETVTRWPHVRELYSSDGAPAPVYHSYGFPSPVPELPGWAAVAGFSLLIFALLGVLAGWRTRLSCALSAGLWFYFSALDSTATLNKYSVIALHLMALLALSDCGRVWSLDALLARRRRAAAAAAAGEEPAPAPVFRGPAWPRRLIQLHIGLVYLGAAFTKMQTPDFFSGDQTLYWMLTHVNRPHPLGPFMVHNPILLVIGGYATCVWEVAFLFTGWRGWGKRVMLSLGVGFHLMTTLTLGLFLFPLVCFSAYLAWVDEDTVAAAGRGISRIRRWWGERFAAPRVALPGVPTPVLRWGYLAAAPLVMLAGTGAEHRLDPYGERGPDGPLPLAELDPTLVRIMTAPGERVRPTDALFGFEVGTSLVAGHVVDRRDAFRIGETVLVQASLCPPHGDVVLICDLCDADGRAIEHSTLLAPREQPRHQFEWVLDDTLPPGEYRFRLRIEGRPAAVRRFTLLPAG